MARRSQSQTLTLWANGEYVGRWSITARGDMELQYDDRWLASARGRPISLSLPFSLDNEVPVSYTHLTLPTNREV